MKKVKKYEPYKFFFDRLFALAILIIFFPILTLISILIWIEDFKTPFFIQVRVGKNAKEFKIIKFRTMFINADNLLDSSGNVTSNRITRVGRFLRRYSIDELPQLINILKGEMSFIGPRPALKSHFFRYTERQKRRLDVLPGITGLAQVNGRNTIPWTKRIDYDLMYIDRINFLLDLKIIYKTFSIVFSGRGVVLDRNQKKMDDLKNHGP